MCVFVLLCYKPNSVIKTSLCYHNKKPFFISPFFSIVRSVCGQSIFEDDDGRCVMPVFALHMAAELSQLQCVYQPLLTSRYLISCGYRNKCVV